MVALSGIMGIREKTPKGTEIVMPDIALRLNKDMLVLSASLDARLEKQGFDAVKDAGYIALFESDTVRDALRMDALAGATCLVANTAAVTPSRLTRLSMEDQAAEFVEASLAVVREVKPQHVLAEIGPCGLPLDATSKASLNENREQYARAARLFAGGERSGVCGGAGGGVASSGAACAVGAGNAGVAAAVKVSGVVDAGVGGASDPFDALFLNGFATCDDLKCALMGLRQVTDMPVFASVDVRADGTLSSGRGTLEEALFVMCEYGATVAGFATAASVRDAVLLARRARKACDLPLLAQLSVAKRNPKQGVSTEENPYYCPDVMVEAASLLRAAGVQFLRATGDATPAYTGALAAAVNGFDVVLPEGLGEGASDSPACGRTGASDAESLDSAAVSGGGETSDNDASGNDAGHDPLASLMASARAEINAAIGKEG